MGSWCCVIAASPPRAASVIICLVAWPSGDAFALSIAQNHLFASPATARRTVASQQRVSKNDLACSTYAFNQPHRTVPLGMEACELYDSEPSEGSSDRYKRLPTFERWSRHWSLQSKAAIPPLCEYRNSAFVAFVHESLNLLDRMLPFLLRCICE
jgi:hypothetical protein